MKISLPEFFHRLVYLLVSIVFTVGFFLLLESFHDLAAKTIVFSSGIIGFILLGAYDIRMFKGKWI